MSDSHSTTPAPSGKPVKPSADFPLFAHATKRWAKKINGKMYYFGRWDDPEGALRAYQAFLSGNDLIPTPADATPATPLTPVGAGGSPKPAKPDKPSADFPLFAHASGQWAKKVKGRIYYFGSWSDPLAALEKYNQVKGDLEAGKEPTRPVKPRRPDSPIKPNKPYADFPLFAHATGQWAKKIRGTLHYFGTWSDPDAALENYLAKKEALEAGRTPRAESDPESLAVKDIANAFLKAKEDARDAGELSPRTWLDYRSIMVMMVDGLGKRRSVADLQPQDFATLKYKLAKRNGPSRLCTIIQVIRCAFKYAYDSDILDRPIRFGPVFKRASKKTLRLQRRKDGPNTYTAGEIRRLIDAAGPTMKAMILLGINCGFGNNDCGTLPLSAVDLHAGLIDYPRPKTGVARRCALWPETVQAIREATANRPEPKEAGDTGLVFLTKYGTGWSKEINAGPVTQEMRKLLKKLGIDGHRNFYTLRHTFRTVADGSKDQPAIYWIMGHEVPDMSSVYRESISDDRLRAVADHVRKWLFPSLTLVKTAGE
ncbi:MAG TPA: tyrosine-type recombinase/integrase [Gemmataceae bacterium]|nr:tyrosine-type recombinase/integrase [Gemmataceae bacterium]